MTLEESVVNGVKIDGVLSDLARRYRLRMHKALAETAPEHLVRYHQLVTGHGGFVRIILRVHVNELHDPVCVGTGGGGEQVRDDVARYGEIMVERRHLPGYNARPQVDEALIFNEPGGPARHDSISAADRAVPVRDRKRRVRHVAFIGLRLGVGRWSERKVAAAVQIEFL